MKLDNEFNKLLLFSNVEWNFLQAEYNKLFNLYKYNVNSVFKQFLLEKILLSVAEVHTHKISA